MSEAFIHETTVIDPGAQIGEGTRIWHFCHISAGAAIGQDCSFGQNCFVADGVIVGDRVKVQNNVSLYEGVTIEDDVFIGPSAVMTNVKTPRAEVSRKDNYQNILIQKGATIGANVTLICPLTIGAYAFVAAGSVVTADVPDHALVQGNPARQVGWASHHGLPLPAPDADGFLICPESGSRYREEEPGLLRCLDGDGS